MRDNESRISNYCLVKCGDKQWAIIDVKYGAIGCDSLHMIFYGTVIGYYPYEIDTNKNDFLEREDFIRKSFRRININMSRTEVLKNSVNIIPLNKEYQVNKYIQPFRENMFYIEDEFELFGDKCLSMDEFKKHIYN